jgi:hypothetical protein
VNLLDEGHLSAVRKAVVDTARDLADGTVHLLRASGNWQR